MVLLLTFSQKHNLLQEAYAALSSLEIEIGFEVPAAMPEVICMGGKPRFKMNSPCFNLTHTEGLSAVVFSSGEVGVDAEKHRAVNLKLLSRLEQAKDEKEFFDKWTRREAYLKYTGEGLSALRCRVPGNAPITTLDILDGYSLSVCGEGEIIIKTF